MKEKNGLLKLVSALCVGFLFMFTLSACSQKVEDGYYKAVGFDKVGVDIGWNQRPDYIERLVDRVPYFRVEDGDIITKYPTEKKIALEDFKSMSGSTYKEGRSLLDSIYSIEHRKDTLDIRLYFNASPKFDKRFVVKYISVSKKEYEKGVQKLISKRKEINKSYSMFNLSSLDYKKPIPMYLKNYESLKEVEKVFNTASNGRDFMRVYHDTLNLKVSQNRVYDFDIIGVNNSSLVNKRVANIDEMKFDNIEIYTNKDLTLEGIMVKQDSVDSKEAIYLFNLLKERNNNAMFSTFGLPTIEEEGHLYATDPMLAVKWFVNDKAILYVIDSVPKELVEKEIAQKVFLSSNSNMVQQEVVLLHYLKLIKKSNIYVYVMSPDFDKLLKTKGANGKYQDLHHFHLKSYLYGWTGFYPSPYLD